MSQAQRVRSIEDRLPGDDRGSFVGRDAPEVPFAAPTVESFDMDGLDMGSVSALTPNGKTDTNE